MECRTRDGEHEHATGSKQARDLFENRVQVGDVFEDGVRDDKVERTARFGDGIAGACMDGLVESGSKRRGGFKRIGIDADQGARTDPVQQ
jgi:hypothetical protein